MAAINRHAIHPLSRLRERAGVRTLFARSSLNQPSI